MKGVHAHCDNSWTFEMYYVLHLAYNYEVGLACDASSWVPAGRGGSRQQTPWALAHPRIFPEEGGAAVLEAARKGDAEQLVSLLRQGLDPACAGAGGETPLMVAAAAGSQECVAALLGEGTRTRACWLLHFCTASTVCWLA